MSRGAAGRGQKFPVRIVSHEEIQQIKDSAALAGMSVCRYVRQRATGSTVVSKQDVQLLRELNLIGNWLIRLTKSGHDVSEPIAELRAAIAKIRG